MHRFKYNPLALKSALVPSLSEVDRLVTRSKKRQRLNTNGVSTDPSTLENYSEYGVVLETSKERFLVVRHGKNSRSTSVDEANRVPSDKPIFTISLIQGEVEIKGGLPSSTATNLEDPTPIPEEPKSPLPTPEQPTKEPSPVEPLPPVSTPQEVKQVVQGPERERSTEVVDMELDTPVSVTPTATTAIDIPAPGKGLPSGDELEPGQDTVQQTAKPTAYGNKPQHEEKALPMGNVSAKVEAVSLKPPSAPASVTGPEIAHTEIFPPTSVPVPRSEALGSPQVKLKLQILQRNIRGDDLVFGDDGLGVLSADVDPLDNTKKGWLIEAPLWRGYNGRISDCVVVN